MTPVPLPPIAAEHSCNAALPPEISHLLGQTIDAFAEASDWQARAELAESFATWLSPEPGVIGWTAARAAASRRLVTALLEQLGESQISDPTQAAMYLASDHAGWCRAAGRFIAGLPPNELDGWMRERKAIVSFIVATAPAESAS